MRDARGRSTRNKIFSIEEQFFTTEGKMNRSQGRGIKIEGNIERIGVHEGKMGMSPHSFLEGRDFKTRSYIQSQQNSRDNSPTFFLSQ